jgi:hypothetical protein
MLEDDVTDHERNTVCCICTTVCKRSQGPQATETCLLTSSQQSAWNDVILRREVPFYLVVKELEKQTNMDINATCNRCRG